MIREFVHVLFVANESQNAGVEMDAFFRLLVNVVTGFAVLVIQFAARADEFPFQDARFAVARLDQRTVEVAQRVFVGRRRAFDDKHRFRHPLHYRRL